MQKFSILFLVLFLVPVLLFGQTNFHNGYVVNIKGDTLKGMINYREWAKNPDRISLKSDDGRVSDFSPRDAKAFGVTGFEYYETFTVGISQDPIGISSPVQTDSTVITRKVFLKVLSVGAKVSMFSYTDDIKVRFYVAEASTLSPVELVYRAGSDGTSPIKYNYRYRVQLINLLQKYDRQATTDHELFVSRSRYAKQDVMKVIQFINGNESSSNTSVTVSGVRLFTGIGVNYTRLKYEGNISFAQSSTDISNTLFPKASVGIDIFTNKFTQRFFVRLEAAFTADRHKISGPASDNGLNVTTGKATQTFTQYRGGFIPQLVYNIYNTNSLKAFVDVGAALNFAGYNDYVYTETFDNGQGGHTTKKYPEYRNFYFSLPVKVGVSIHKHVEVYAGYEPSTSLTQVSGYSANITAYQAGINYLFGTK